METLVLNNVGLSGINTDVAQWELSAEFITDGKNFRIKSGKLVSVNSEYTWDTNAVLTNPGLLVPVRDEFWIIAGRSAVYAYDGAAFYNISSTAGYAAIPVNGELNWNSALLGKIPVLNNFATVPEYWSPQSGATILQPLMYDAANDWATQGWKCKVIRSHGSYLFALYMTESGVEYPDSFRWSHPADINGLPPSWDEADTSYIAGKSATGGDYGQLVDGGSIRDSFCLYSTKGINILDPSLDELVWRKRELSSTIGMLSDNSWVEVKGVHFILGEVDILMNDGSKVESILHNKLRQRLIQNVNPSYFDRSYVTRNDRYKELWFCVPEGSTQYPNIAYVYNYKDDSWAIQELPNNTTHTSFGLQLDAPETYATTTEVYDTTILTYAGQVRSPLNNRVIGVDTADNLIIVDPEISSAANTDAFIERQNFALEGHDVVTTITEVIPHITGDPVYIQIGSHEKTGDNIVWQPAITFDPNTDRRVDILSTGALHGWKISTIGNGNFELSGMTIKYERSGLR